MNDEQIRPESDETACTQCADYLDGWKRCKADYENLLKETERRRADFTKYANEELLSVLLPAIDQYETALAFTPDVSGMPEEMQKPLKNWIIGLHAVRDLWETAFRQIGLEKVPTEGAFDPTIHDAVEQETSDTVAAGDIVKVLQDGWRLRDKLLRPAKVIVSSEPSS